MRVRTVEHESGQGWIARDPANGKEIIDNFRWRTRNVARCVVDETRMLLRSRALAAGDGGRDV